MQAEGHTENVEGSLFGYEKGLNNQTKVLLTYSHDNFFSPSAPWGQQNTGCQVWCILLFYIYIFFAVEQ